MSRTAPHSRGRRVLFAAFIAAALGACSEAPTTPTRPVVPPEPPPNPQIVSAAWIMDVNRTTGTVRVTPPSRGLNAADLAILADYFGIEPGSPDLSILAGDVVEILTEPGTFNATGVGVAPAAPGEVRVTFGVRVRNKLTGVNILTPTFPEPPVGTNGVVLFPFQIVVTETPGGATGGQGDGTEVIVELPNRGDAMPSVDWDLAEFNFFNDSGCSAQSNDCYRSELFAQPLQGGATSEVRTVGFDIDPTVSQFRVRMILAGDLEDATVNTPPVAEAGGPYNFARGVPSALAGSGSDPDLGGSIVSYLWDLDNDGQHDDASGANALYTCAAGGSFPISLQVTDNRGATDTDGATVNCSDAPPVAEAGGPYSGVAGAATTLAGSATDDGTIVSYAWDLDADGQFDDASGPSPSYTCSAAGSFTVSLRVTDDAAQTGDDSAIVTCAAELVGVAGARWLNAGGSPITSAAVGATVRLQIDVNMGANLIDLTQGQVNYSSALATATGATDLNCDPGNSCPSGTGTVTDVLNFFTANPNNPGVVIFSNASVSGNGNAIQGLITITFTLNASGTLSPALANFVAAHSGGVIWGAGQIQQTLPSLIVTP